MKIRILGNAIRLRLTKSEVEQVNKTGLIEQAVCFDLESKLKYCLKKSSKKTICAQFVENTITVLVPETIIADWAESEQVGISDEVKTGTESNLKILIEKDFKCLTKRVGENEEGMFPHPDKNQLSC